MVNGRIGKRRNGEGRNGRGRSGHKPSFYHAVSFLVICVSRMPKGGFLGS